METLHIYGQASWHDEAWIAGNREGLMLLRDAIDKALTGEMAKSDNVFTTDGEGYRILVLNLPDNEIDQMAMPYTADHAQNGGGTWPWEMARKMAPNAELWGAPPTGGASHTNAGLGAAVPPAPTFEGSTKDEH